MYRGFVFAQDAISDFVRSMDDANKIAFYSYSRDLSRATMLTADRFRVVNGVRSTVAGDDAALYNCLLMTVKDAAMLTGTKAIVVFSNGPDNASSVPPEDVAELAQSTGTIIYIVSTRLAQDEPVSAAAFERMSKATGGKAYFAGNWRKEKRRFRIHPRRSGPSVFAQLLSAAQSQPRLAHHQREAGRQGHAEVSHPHARRLPPVAADADQHRPYLASGEPLQRSEQQ